jgi:hypothetical protein
LQQTLRLQPTEKRVERALVNLKTLGFEGIDEGVSILFSLQLAQNSQNKDAPA